MKATKENEYIRHPCRTRGTGDNEVFDNGSRYEIVRDDDDEDPDTIARDQRRVP